MNQFEFERRLERELIKQGMPVARVIAAFYNPFDVQVRVFLLSLESEGKVGRFLDYCFLGDLPIDHLLTKIWSVYCSRYPSNSQLIP